MKRTIGWSAVVVGLGFAASCSVVNAPDDALEPSGTTTTAAGGGGSGTGTTSGGSGALGGEGGLGGGGAQGGGDSCGNGAIDTALGETCDPPSSCPSCDDGVECTADTTDGAPETCNVLCGHEDITTCQTDADGCCPVGCTGMTDPDCADCGNGTVELGETCDGNCPTSCPADDLLCTVDELVGSAEQCTAECSHAAVTQCSAQSDACCPAGCNGTTDADCEQGLLILHNAATVIADVATKLEGTGAFATIADIDVDAAMPTLQQLQPYDVVLAFSGSSFGNPAALGDVLADYYDGGGRVVTATFSTCANGTLAIAGRFGTVTNGYVLLTGLTQAQPTDSLGTIQEPDHMLMTGVHSFSASTAFRCPGSPANGAVVVATWQNGDPLVVRGTVGGRPRAHLNFFPPSSSVNAAWWAGHGVEMMRNALLYQ
jgi:hypothetical protein